MSMKYPCPGYILELLNITRKPQQDLHLRLNTISIIRPPFTVQRFQSKLHRDTSLLTPIKCNSH